MWKSFLFTLLIGIPLFSTSAIAQDKRYCDCDWTTFPVVVPLIVPVNEGRATKIIFAWCVPGCFGENPPGAYEEYLEAFRDEQQQSTATIDYNGTIRSIDIVIPHD